MFFLISFCSCSVFLNDKKNCQLNLTAIYRKHMILIKKLKKNRVIDSSFFFLFICLFVVLLLTGCSNIHSKNPLYEKKDLVYIPDIDGYWILTENINKHKKEVYDNDENVFFIMEKTDKSYEFIINYNQFYTGRKKKNTYKSSIIKIQQ